MPPEPWQCDLGLPHLCGQALPERRLQRRQRWPSGVPCGRQIQAGRSDVIRSDHVLHILPVRLQPNLVLPWVDPADHWHLMYLTAQ